MKKDFIKNGKKISISNPGTLRITKEEFYAGGNSDPRNPNILKMFGTDLRSERQMIRDDTQDIQDIDNAAQATQATTQVTTQAAVQDNNIQERLLALISENGKLSQKEMAHQIGENYNTVKYYILQMKKKGIIERIGTSQKGHWKIRR